MIVIFCLLVSNICVVIWLKWEKLMIIMLEFVFLKFLFSFFIGLFLRRKGMSVMLSGVVVMVSVMVVISSEVVEVGNRKVVVVVEKSMKLNFLFCCKSLLIFIVLLCEELVM